MDSFIALMLIVVAVSNLLPAALVIVSRRVHGQDLSLWFFAVLFTSWLGFVAFMTVTTLDRRTKAGSAAALRQSRNLRVMDISDHAAR